MGKRIRDDGHTAAPETPIITRTGWLHLSNGDVQQVREIAASMLQKWMPYCDEFTPADWVGVPVCEWGLIEWDEG